MVVERGGGFFFDMVIVVWEFLLFIFICEVFVFVVCIFFCFIDFSLGDFGWLKFIDCLFNLDDKIEGVLEFLKIFGYLSFNFLKWFCVCCMIFFWVKRFFLNMMFFWFKFFDEERLIMFLENLFLWLWIDDKKGLICFCGE